MKNQYVGDINDYRKYGLLRALQSDGNRSLLVAWMLTADDGGRDGGFRGYLESPATWAQYDDELFNGLVDLVRAGLPRTVSMIEAAGLLPRASYYSALVPDSRRSREAWREELLRVAAGVDLVFLDPDNGIEVRSQPRQAFTARIAGELRSRTCATLVEAFQTPHVLFLLAAQDRHAQGFRDLIPLLSRKWQGQIKATGLANQL